MVRVGGSRWCYVAVVTVGTVNAPLETPHREVDAAGCDVCGGGQVDWSVDCGAGSGTGKRHGAVMMWVSRGEAAEGRWGRGWWVRVAGTCTDDIVQGTQVQPAVRV